MKKKKVLLRMMTCSDGVVEQSLEVFGAVNEGEVEVMKRLSGDGHAKIVTRIHRVPNITESNLEALTTSSTLHHPLDFSLNVFESVKGGEKRRILLAILGHNSAVDGRQRATEREDKAAPVEVRVGEKKAAKDGKGMAQINCEFIE